MTCLLRTLVRFQQFFFLFKLVEGDALFIFYLRIFVKLSFFRLKLIYDPARDTLTETCIVFQFKKKIVQHIKLPTPKNKKKAEALECT